ncbi:MAG: hypothetical protein EZS28_052502, partial [Streblomastix strix]
MFCDYFKDEDPSQEEFQFIRSDNRKQTTQQMHNQQGQQINDSITGQKKLAPPIPPPSQQFQSLNPIKYDPIAKRVLRGTNPKYLLTEIVILSSLTLPQSQQNAQQDSSIDQVGDLDWDKEGSESQK